MPKYYPYERYIERIAVEEEEVTIERRDAPPIRGKIHTFTEEFEEDGFLFISSEGTEPGAKKRIFIAYVDVRGISTTMKHDPD